MNRVPHCNVFVNSLEKRALIVPEIAMWKKENFDAFSGHVIKMALPAAPKAPQIKPAKVMEVDPQEVTRLAPMYRVLIHNDDVTPMDYVVKVLKDIFGKGSMASIKIMFVAHSTGVALVVVLPLEEAEFRVERAHAMARTEKYPLTFTYEPE